MILNSARKFHLQCVPLGLTSAIHRLHPRTASTIKLNSLLCERNGAGGRWSNANILVFEKKVFSKDFSNTNLFRNLPFNASKNQAEGSKVLMRSFSTPVENAKALPISPWKSKPVEEWTEDDVFEWATLDLNIKEGWAKKLKEQEVDGRILLTLTEEKLMKVGIPLGPATSLALGIEKLKPKTDLVTLPVNADDWIEYVVDTLLKNVAIPGIVDMKSKGSQKALGRFYKIDLPFNSKCIDPRLFDDEVTPVAKELLDWNSEGENHSILLGKSGDGKTRAIMDVAREKFVIYIECVPYQNERGDPSKDVCFARMSREIHDLCSKAIGYDEFVQGVNHLMNLEYAARLMFLYLYSKKHPNLTPQQFLHSQVNGGQKCMLDIVTHMTSLSGSQLRNLQYPLLERIENDLLSRIGQTRLIFALDEAGTIQKFNERFKSPKTQSPRGLLTPLVRSLMALNVSTIYAGTNRSLGLGETLQSDIGKADRTRIITKFNYTNKEENRNFFSRKLNLEGVDIDQIDEFYLLTGRHRLRDSVLIHLCDIEPAVSINASKQEVFRLAVEKAIAKHKKTMIERFRSAIQSSREFKLLERLYIAVYFFDGNINFHTPLDSEEIDLVEVGIASLQYEISQENVAAIKINEPLCIQVIREVLSTEKSLKLLHKKLQQTPKGSPRGYEFEPIVACVLRMLSEKRPTIAELARKFGIEEEKLDSVPWTKSARLNISSVGPLSFLELNDESEYLNKTLTEMNRTKSHLLLNVANSMRPDGIAVVPLDDSKFYSVLLSTKLYGSRGFPSIEEESDRRSTDWKKLYFLSDGTEVNPNAKNLYSKWGKVLSDHTKVQHVGSLRLHAILPHIQSRFKPVCTVEGNDVIIYVTKHNANCIFDQSTIEVLAKCTGTKKEDWISPKDQPKSAKKKVGKMRKKLLPFLSATQDAGSK